MVNTLLAPGVLPAHEPKPTPALNCALSNTNSVLPNLPEWSYPFASSVRQWSVLQLKQKLQSSRGATGKRKEKNRSLMFHKTHITTRQSSSSSGEPVFCDSAQHTIRVAVPPSTTTNHNFNNFLTHSQPRRYQSMYMNST